VFDGIQRKAALLKYCTSDTDDRTTLRAFLLSVTLLTRFRGMTFSRLRTTVRMNSPISSHGNYFKELNIMKTIFWQNNFDNSKIICRIDDSTNGNKIIK